MKKFHSIVLLGVLLSAFIFPMSASAQELELGPNFDDKVVFGGSFTLSEGEEILGDLISFGGNITLEEGSTLDGNFMSMGGNSSIAGNITGDVVALGSSINLEASAIVGGDLAILGTSLNRDPGAQVLGNVITETIPINFDIPRVPNILFERDSFFNFNFRNGDNFPGFTILDGIGRQQSLTGRVASEVQSGLFNAFAMAAIAILAVLFVPKHAKRVSNTALSEPLAAGGLSLLSIIVLPILMVVMSVTIILIPIVLLLAFLIVLALVFGWVSIGWEIGKRLLNALNLDWAEPLQAGTGAFVLTFSAALIGLVPCLGGLASFLVVIVSFGGVMLSRFGTQDYPVVEEIEVKSKPLPKKSSASKKTTKEKATRKKKGTAKK